MFQVYAQKGHLPQAWKFFNTSQQKDVVSWNKVLSACAKFGNGENALSIFDKFPERSVVSWTTVLTAVAASRHSIGMVRAIFDEMPQRDFVSWTAFLMAFTREASGGSMVDAGRVFDRMPGHGIAAWNTLIMGYIADSQDRVALNLFSSIARERSVMVDEITFVSGFKACSRLARDDQTVQIMETGMALHAQALDSGFDCCSNVFLASTLIDMYSSCRSLIDARKVFDRMVRHDVVCWNSLLTAYIQNEDERLALDLFEGMTCSPDRLTFATAVRACSGLAKKEAGQEIEGKTLKVDSLQRGFAVHSRIIGSCYLDLVLASSLIDMYTKCGSMIDARAVVDRIPVHTTISADDAAVLWTSLLLGYAESGEGDIAVELFWKLQELGGKDLSSEAVFLAAAKACGSISSGCSKSLRSIHGEACRRGTIHGQCGQWNTALETTLVDCYAKAGDLEDAQRIFDCSTRDRLTWNALIGAYARHGDAARGFDLFVQMVNEGLTPDGVTILSLLTLCSHTGLVDRGRKISETVFSATSSVRFSIEHYHAVIDLLGRSNRIEEAAAVIRSMPFEANAVTWRTLLSACGKWKNTKVAGEAFQSLMLLDPQGTAGHDMVSKLFQIV